MSAPARSRKGEVVGVSLLVAAVIVPTYMYIAFEPFELGAAPWWVVLVVALATCLAAAVGWLAIAYEPFAVHGNDGKRTLGLRSLIWPLVGALVVLAVCVLV